MSDNIYGKVWLVGSGPSDPELLTVKASRLIDEADVIVYDALIGESILSLLPLDKELIDVGKIAGNHKVPQEEINKILLNKALEGKNVVRLKGGDPFVFGRGGEELELLLENNIEFEVVPGITSAVSVPAYNGIPVTHRDFTTSFHVITGHTKSKKEAEIDYESLVRLDGTLVFLMGVGAMENICKSLINAGMDENMPAAVLERGTRSGQKKVISTVSRLFEDAKLKNIKAPAIILVGKVCQLGNSFDWWQKKALAGLKIGVTRPKERASNLAIELRKRGAEVIMLPSIKIEPIDDIKQDEIIKNIKDFDVIVFTSQVGVRIFFEKLIEKGIDSRSLSNTKFAVVGQGTKQSLQKYGIIADYMPDVFTGANLGKEILKYIDKESKVLIPRALKGGDELIEILTSSKAEIIDMPIYNTVSDKNKSLVKFTDDMDAVAFSSASAVKVFVENHKNLDMSKVNAVCIGSETAKAAREVNMKIFISSKATIKSLVDCIEENFGNRNR